MEYLPDRSLVPRRTTRPSALRACTTAPTTGAPAGSSTVPAITPAAGACAAALDAHNTATATPATTRPLELFNHCMICSPVRSVNVCVGRLRGQGDRHVEHERLATVRRHHDAMQALLHQRDIAQRDE